jgi:hypothetical protein
LRFDHGRDDRLGCRAGACAGAPSGRK